MIDQRLRMIKEDPYTPFGGVHVLVIGDLFQLPPCKARKLWEMSQPLKGKPDYSQGKYALGAKYKGNTLAENVWLLFKLFELDEIMRQKDEKEWAEWLNRL